MTANELVGYDELDDTLVHLRLGTSASELHGSLSGYLAGGGTIGRQATVLSVLQLDGDGAPPTGRDALLLERLARQSETELADPELGFEPMLPADDRPLPERADALVEWCQGFLGGFGLTGAQGHGQLSDEAKEVLRDFGTIAASALDFGDQGEDEDALIEVQEFVRVGAMLLHTECTATSKPASGSLH